MYRILTTLFCLFLLSCNPAKQVTSLPTPTPISANRVMIVIKPIKVANLPISGFLQVCDSIFKKNNITHTLLPFNNAIFSPIKSNFYSETMKKFKPDCLILLVPKKSGSTSVQYDAYIVPFDVTDLLFMQNKESQPLSPTFISSFKLQMKGNAEKSKQNGIQVANKFIETLKKYIVTIK